MRHRLTPWLRTLGGHVGYHTHPEHRMKGVATYALRAALQILRQMGAEAALITCSESNTASAAVIEKCGGVRAQDAVVAGFEARRRDVVPIVRDGWFGEFEDLRRP